MSVCGSLEAMDPEELRVARPIPVVYERMEEEEEEVEGEGEEVVVGDYFDLLPDVLLLEIFNRIGDVKALGRCCVVSRRFHALAALVDGVVVRVDCVISDDESSSLDAGAGCGGSDKPRGVLSSLARLVLGGLAKPFQALGQILTASSSSSCRCSDASSASAAARRSASSSSSEVSHHSPTEVLRNFKEIRRLRIELPDGELGGDDGVLLKWRANFGSTLDRCVILGASSVLCSAAMPPESSTPDSNPSCGGDDCGDIPDSFYSDGSLKRRVVWTISSLIAASARHYLLHQIVADHETLESLNLTDADGQGVLTMDRQQLQELRAKPVMASGSSQRTLLPALSMRLWYAHQLELPDGMVLKGATLLAIRPSEERTKDANGGVGGSSGCFDGSWVADAFEEPYRTATRMLMRRRTYCLEMNSF